MPRLTDSQREQNAKQAKENYDICQRGFYQYNGANIQIPLKTDDDVVIMPKDIDNLPKLSITPENETKVSLEDKTTLEAASRYKIKYPDREVIAINFASYRHPGGGYLTGAYAQEEVNCQMSNLYNHLEKFKSSFSDNETTTNNGCYTDKMFYLRNVYSFRDNNLNLLPQDKVTNISIISSAAPNRMRKAKEVREMMSREIMPRRIENMFRVILKHRQNTGKKAIIIAGAYGCGVFQNDPEVVAQCFLKTADKCDFADMVFAIPGKWSSNYQAFQSIFEKDINKNFVNNISLVDEI